VSRAFALEIGEILARIHALAIIDVLVRP
jgi:hypothetical protein